MLHRGTQGACPASSVKFPADPPSFASFSVLNHPPAALLPMACVDYFPSGTPSNDASRNSASQNFDANNKITRGANADFYVPDQVTFPEFVFSCLERHGEKKCLVDWTAKKTYTGREIIEDSRKISSYLIHLGMKKGDILCAYIGNSYEYVVTLFGVAAAGGIVTAANPLLKYAELSAQVKDAGAIFILANQDNISIARRVASTNQHIRAIFVTGEGEESLLCLARKHLATSKLPAALNPRTTNMTLIYSSGTTGLPKGVIRTQYNFTWTMCMYRASQIFTLGPNDTLLTVLPMYYLMGLEMVLISLVVGAKLILLDRFNKNQVGEIIQQQKVTFLPIVPAILHALTEDFYQNYCLASLKVVFSGGARLNEMFVSELRKKWKLPKFVQGYGATETGIVTMTEIEDRNFGIGFPIPEVQLMVVNIHTNLPLGPYERGELLVKTPLLMKGYLKRERETIEAITLDGWFRTGDIVYYDEHRCFHLVDRKKEIIKYKGHQVSPAELESLLRTHKAVSEAAVVGIPDAIAGELPKGFVVLKPDFKETTGKELQEYIAAQVAPHKRLRGGVTFLEKLPKSSVGKILKKKLIS